MAQLALSQIGAAPVVRGKREPAQPGDFVKDQLDQVAAEVSEFIADDSEANRSPVIAGFVANHRDSSGDNVIPLSFRPTRVGRKSVNTLTRWNGYVDSIEQDYFTAVVFDTARGGEREEARIPKRLLEGSELRYLKRGAQLQMIVGLSNAAAGNRIKETIVYFRRYVEDQPSIADDLLSLLEQLRNESAG